MIGPGSNPSSSQRAGNFNHFDLLRVFCDGRSTYSRMNVELSALRFFLGAVLSILENNEPSSGKSKFGNFCCVPSDIVVI